MSVNVQFAGFEIKNALLPTIELTLRTNSQETVPAYFTSALCDVYYGKGFAFNEMPYVFTVPALINQWVRGQSSIEFRIILTFSQEILYKLDKLIPVGQNPHFAINTRLHYYIQGERPNSLGEPRLANELSSFMIASSEWAKIAYDWGKEMALMPIAPKLYEKIKELARTGKFVGGTNDFLDELLSRYVKTDIER